MSLASFVDSFVPTNVTDKQEIYRARIFVYSMFSLGCFGATYNLIYFKVGNWVGGTVILLEALLVWILPSIFKRKGNLVSITHWFALSYSLMMATILASSGGASFTSNPWWAVSPVFVILVLGIRAGRLWLIVALSVLAIAYLASELGFEFPNLISTAPEDAAWVRFLHWFHFFGCVLMLSLSAVVFDYINRDALTIAATSLDQAEKATAISEEQNRYLAESVDKILAEMVKLEHGNLTVRLAVAREDEIGSLCKGFNSSVANINKAILEVSAVVGTATQSSLKINQAAADLAAGTQRQTEQANQITQSVASLVAGISQNAQSAMESSGAAQHNGEVARKGGEVVQKTVQKIDQIARVVEKAAQSIGQLASSSREIGEIVSVIQAIASRTNLLALNASIEAAHAGAAGAGFGVIANEVKELAGQTARATEKITQMIHAVQGETQEVINDMALGNEQVHEGKQLAGLAGAALDEIVESSANLTNIVEEISQSCAHQSEQSNWFLSQVQDMRNITETAAHKINEIAASTQNLDQLTGRINQEMGRFQTRV